MKVPEIVQKASIYPLRYIGDYQRREVYARVIPEEDDGLGTGYPFVYLYDGKHVEEKCVGLDYELSVWFFENV